MIKTLEDMDKVELLAASYACDYRDSPSKTNGVPDSYLVYSIAYDGFLAGYQAAKDEMNSPEKLDSSNSLNNSNGWISVKERLPEVGQRVLIYNPLEYVSIVMADYYNTTRPFFDHITLDDIHLNIYPDEDKQLYWMPLPKPPEEKK